MWVLSKNAEKPYQKNYLLIPYKNMQAYLEVSDALENDDHFKSAAETYPNTPPDKIPAIFSIIV